MSVSKKNRVAKHVHSSADIIGSYAPAGVHKTLSNPGYTGGDLFVTGKTEIPCDAPSKTNLEILESIFGWAMSYCTVNVASGSTSVTVYDASKFVVGQVITVADATKNEQATLESKSGNTLTLASGLSNTYSTSQQAHVIQWCPAGINNPSRPLRFKDNNSLNWLDYFLLISSDNYNAPLSYLNQGWVCQKDGAFGGFVSAQQGQYWYGHGLNTPTDAPKDVMAHSHDYNLTDNVAAGTTSIPVYPGVIFLTGVPLIIEDNNHSEMVIVKSKTLNTVTIQQPLQHSYSTAAGAHLYEPYFTKWIVKADGSTLAGERMGWLELAEGGLHDLAGDPYVLALDNMPNQGTDGYVLTAKGAGNPPEWAASGGGDTEEFTASGAVTQYRIASIVGNETVATATLANAQASIGVFQATVSTGQPVTVKTRGRTSVTAGGTLTAGDHITTDDLGRAIKLPGHRHTAGILGKSLAFASTVATGTPSATNSVVSSISGTATSSGTTTVVTSVSLSQHDGHTHQCDNGTGGSDDNLNATYVAFKTCPSGHSNCQVDGYAHYRFATSLHSHAIFFTTNLDGIHNHTVSPSTTSVASSSHSHNVNYSSSYVASSTHTHTMSGLPTYIRSLTMYAVGGGTFYLGGVLSNTDGEEANIYTAYAAEPFMRAIVVKGATVGNLAQIIIS